MRTTENHDTSSVEQVITPATEIHDFIQENNPAKLRADLSEMLIAWMKQPENALLTEEHKQDVYHSYYVMSTMLKMVENEA